MRLSLQRIILAAGCTVAAPAAFADVQLPPMKPGFWQSSMVMHMNMSGQPADTDNTPTVTYSCQSAQTMADAMKHMSGGMPGCDVDIAGSGGTYKIAINCANMGGQPGKLTGSGTMVFEGMDAMHLQESSSMVAPGMTMKMDMVGDSKWAGQCPSGVAPGDFGTMANGAFQKEGNYADLGKVTAPASGN
jgi:hypothetical protein